MLSVGAGIVAVLIFAVAGATNAARSQEPADATTIWAGVFSEIQARRGEKVADVYCSGCHGPDLEGGDSGPKLVGSTFLDNWNDKTIGDLFEFVRTEMPADAPNSLSLQNTTFLIAYILELNKVPSSTRELAADRTELNRIKIVRK